MKTIGQGVREIRTRAASGAFRVIYLAVLEDRGSRSPCVPEEDAEHTAKGNGLGGKTPKIMEGFDG